MKWKIYYFGKYSIILGIFDINLTVLINIDAFLIDHNIGNSGDTCKSKQKDYNLAIGQQKNKKRSAKDAVA